MQGLVQYQQLGVFYKSTCQQYQPLLATRQLQELAFCEMSDAKDVKPPTAFYVVLFVGDSIQSDGVHQTTGHNADGWQVALVGAMHLGRDVADVLLDIPDALARASRTVKEGDVAGIALRVVCTYQ